MAGRRRTLVLSGAAAAEEHCLLHWAGQRLRSGCLRSGGSCLPGLSLSGELELRDDNLSWSNLGQNHEVQRSISVSWRYASLRLCESQHCWAAGGSMQGRGGGHSCMVRGHIFTHRVPTLFADSICVLWAGGELWCLHALSRQGFVVSPVGTENRGFKGVRLNVTVCVDSWASTSSMCMYFCFPLCLGFFSWLGSF